MKSRLKMATLLVAVILANLPGMCKADTNTSIGVKLARAQLLQTKAAFQGRYRDLNSVSAYHFMVPKAWGPNPWGGGISLSPTQLMSKADSALIAWSDIPADQCVSLVSQTADLADKIIIDAPRWSATKIAKFDGKPFLGSIAEQACAATGHPKDDTRYVLWVLH